MQQKLLSYQIFTEIMNATPRQTGKDTAASNIKSPKGTSEIYSHFRQHEDASLMVSEIPSDASFHVIQPRQNNILIEELPSETRWLPPAVPQILKQSNKQPMSNNDLKEVQKDKTISQLTMKVTELEQAIRGYEQQLSVKEKEYHTFREIISNMEEDIMDFRSEVRKGQLEAKELSDKHAKQVATLHQELAQFRQAAKQSKIKHNLIMKDKEMELANKESQLAQSIDTNSRLLDELIVLRKDKDIRKEQVDKQHQLILQYERRNDESTKEIMRLTDEIQQIKMRNVPMLSMPSVSRNNRTNSVRTTSRERIQSKSLQKSSQIRLKTKIAQLKKELLEMKQHFLTVMNKVSTQTQSIFQNLVTGMQEMHQSNIMARNEELETLRKQMIKLKVEVFELQLKQENSRPARQPRQTDNFWMAKLLESSSMLEQRQSSKCLNTPAQSSKSSRKTAKEYDMQRRNKDEIKK